MSNAKAFWNGEYTENHLYNLSTEPSHDVVKCIRWARQEYGNDVFRKDTRVLDVGCGNGRHALYMARELGVHAEGFDISAVAIEQARVQAQKNSISQRTHFYEQNANEPLPYEDGSIDMVLDLMTSHYLTEHERVAYIKEVSRVLAPQGILLFKSFFAKGDRHLSRLLRQHGTEEENTYIHPHSHMAEYVWTDEALLNMFDPYFICMKKLLTHKHVIHGKPGKRRNVICYFERRE
ncbi:MAG: class I SAM-dependent methyltransferase [Alphaproteobacteria bacterium]|nr:class I SAM-dependent methyltransferase [Alphaproteobacteria bacterium]